ncbi:type II toxin-antitoxin system Phd/YefM family antitoxin [Sporomusa aerivorans]|uniref:type II toxin-antitoxin system Phd/YefM family antitoxin n=1 Tax=Sporomusa aerivorans TaxID=204936 RepID=UPI00352AB790
MKAIIRPMTDLAKKMDEIEHFCITESLPVYITKKGTGRLVVLGHENYENLMSELEKFKEENELYKSLIQAAGESRRGESRDVNDVLDEIDAELREREDDDRQTERKISG